MMGISLDFWCLEEIAYIGAEPGITGSAWCIAIYDRQAFAKRSEMRCQSNRRPITALT